MYIGSEVCGYFLTIGTHTFFVRSSGVLGLPYESQLCLPTDNTVSTLALEDCNSSEIP